MEGLQEERQNREEDSSGEEKNKKTLGEFSE